MKEAIIDTWHTILGKGVLVGTLVKIGDKIKFCDDKQFQIHLLEVTGINHYCDGIEAKDYEANRVYLQSEMLDLEILSDDKFESEKEKYKNAVYRKVTFELSDGFSVKL